MNELQTTIKRVGRPYIDEPIVASPKAGSLVSAVRVACGVMAPKPFVVGHERVILNWIKPGGGPRHPL